ncbi:NmrA family transcriptional regulator [Actinomadura logoneensis]|uniref:NmrA family transcriptional regulator n=1 Tax=Actinomadura logoneensis TaxID=2293572 RepID=A0A372JTR9_9ACTN|nr:NAD(P)H-binding protein [Actinomadura logoneensis]RFU43425.1 NmrA family transcriptional regulator [Actinomadura logoneensis]
MIVITAPTGQIGRRLVDTLLDAGAPVRLIARDPARLPARVHESAEIVQGTHSDKDVLTKALANADGVFWLVPPTPTAPSVEGHFDAFTRPFCEAVTETGVGHVVGVSSLGRTVARNAGQISATVTMDRMIEATGVSYRALEMPGFMDNMLWNVPSLKAEGVFTSAIDPDRKEPSVATRDIAAVAARLLLDTTWDGQEGVQVLGPEDISANDMARVMSDVLERPIRCRRISPEEYGAALTSHGATEAWARGLVDMMTAIDRDGIYHAEPRTPDSRTPTTFRQWCEEVLKPVIHS